MILSRNRNNGGAKVRNQHGALLKGILYDAKTGCALGHTFTKKGNKLYRYYINIQAQKQGWDSCSTPSLPANEIEAFVVEQIRHIGKDKKLQQSVFEESVRKFEEHSSKLESERKVIFSELERLSLEIQNAGKNDDVSQMQSLREQSAILEERLHKIIEMRQQLESERMNESQVREAMANFDPCWNKMTTRERVRLLELIVEKVLVDSEAGKIAIQFRSSGIQSLLKEGKK